MDEKSGYGITRFSARGHEAAVKVLARATVSSEAWRPLHRLLAEFSSLWL